MGRGLVAEIVEDDAGLYNRDARGGANLADRAHPVERQHDPARRSRGAGKAGGANAALATEVEGKLGDNIWLGGQQPSKEDAEKFASMGSSAPNAESHPEAFAWYTLVGRFSQEVRDSWTAAPA